MSTARFSDRPAEREERELTGISGATSAPSFSRAAPASARPRSPPGPRVSVHYRDRRRPFSAALVGIAVVLLGYSLGGAWWQVSLESSSSTSGGFGQIANVEVRFTLGGTIECTAVGWVPPTPCAAVPSSETGPTRLLDLGTYFALLVGIGVGILTAGLVVAGNLGLVLGRRQLLLAIVLAFVVAGVALSTPVVGAVAGPGAQGESICGTLSEGFVDCHLYWGGAPVGPYPGGCYDCANQESWGAGVAWFSTMVAGGLAFLSGYLLWIGRKGPYTNAEERAWAISKGYIDRPRPTPLPIPTRTGEPPEEIPQTSGPGALRSALPLPSDRRASWRCLECGTVNAPWAEMCGRCRSVRPSDRAEAPDGGRPASPPTDGESGH